MLVKDTKSFSVGVVDDEAAFKIASDNTKSCYAKCN